jgi:hypothetical protein
LLVEVGSRFQQTFELSDPGQGYQTYLTNLPVNKKQVFQSFSASYICLQRLAQGFSNPHLLHGPGLLNLLGKAARDLKKQAHEKVCFILGLSTLSLNC